MPARFIFLAVGVAAALRTTKFVSAEQHQHAAPEVPNVSALRDIPDMAV
jgi:hypothetical protein